jgi:hypothetical protein
VDEAGRSCERGTSRGALGSKGPQRDHRDDGRGNAEDHGGGSLHDIIDRGTRLGEATGGTKGHVLGGSLD